MCFLQLFYSPLSTEAAGSVCRIELDYHKLCVLCHVLLYLVCVGVCRCRLTYAMLAAAKRRRHLLFFFVGNITALAAMHRRTSDLSIGLMFVPASCVLRAILLPVDINRSVRSVNCPLLMLLSNVNNYVIGMGIHGHNLMCSYANPRISCATPCCAFLTA